MHHRTVRPPRPLCAPHPRGLYDTHTFAQTQCHVVLCLGSLDPTCVVFSRGATSRVSVCMRCIYPILSAPAFVVVASIHCCCCCISRSSSVHRFIITPHIAILASIRIRIPGPILVPPLVCFTISGGPMSTPPTLVRVPTPKSHVLSQFASLLCLIMFLPTLVVSFCEFQKIGPLRTAGVLQQALEI